MDNSQKIALLCGIIDIEPEEDGGCGTYVFAGDNQMHQTDTSNSVVRLARSSSHGPAPTRITPRNRSPDRVLSGEKTESRTNIGAFSVSRKSIRPAMPAVRNRVIEVPVNPDMRGVRRIIDAIAAGEDTRVAAQKPSSFLSKVLAAALLPLLFISPIAAAASEDVPLAAQVAAVVSDSSPTPPENPSSQTTSPSDSSNDPAPVSPPSSTSDTPKQDPPATPPSGDTPNSSSSSSTENSPAQAPVAPAIPPAEDSSSTPAVVVVAETPAVLPSTSTPTAPVVSVTVDPSSGGSSGDSSGNVSTSTATDSSIVLNENAPVAPIAPSTSKEATSTVIQADETATSSLLDAAPPEQQESMDDIRAQLRMELRGEVEKQIHDEMKDSVRDEVRMELERSVEKKMLEKCTKVPDGSGVYCVNNIDAFGSKTETSNAISVTSAPNPIDHNKEIYLTRGASTWKLTSNPDDDTNPSLDPVGNTLVWQAMQSGRAQINFADMSEAKPSVHVLTSGENNFYPKAFANRIVWQAWIDGNWEVVWAERAKTVVPDEELSPENKAIGVNGEWLVHRVTHNSVPDMFPAITHDGVSWQGVDGGVWQVFTYDFETGKTVRVSRPGVTSEAPESAMVWTERNGSDVRLVGRSLDGSQSIDFTEAARHAGSSGSPALPKTPVNDTQMIVASGVIKVEESAASTTPVVQ